MAGSWPTLTAMAAILTACPHPSAAPAATPPVTVAPEVPAMQRRAFAPTHEGIHIIEGISYGPYREGQRPGGPDPSDEQILEDLNLLAPDWHMIRVYSSRQPTELILKTIRDEALPIQVMVGVWIAADDDAGNSAEVSQAIRLANAYPEQVLAVAVGNETQVAWSGHRSDGDALIGHIRTVRTAIQQPVTTADDYNFWNKAESQAVADEIDFLLLHAYAMWNRQTLDDAVPWTASIVADIKERHPNLRVVMGETGWATERNLDAGPDNDQTKQIIGKAGVAEQARFYREFTAWAAENKQPYFYFEAFDEPWKGAADPREIEKHWGLWDVNRQRKTPKAP